MNAPVALFVYRRVDHTRRVLEDLRAMPEAAHSALYVFSDGPATDAEQADVLAVRALCRDASGFARLSLVERATNLGCAANVIDGVASVLDTHEQVVVVEDDLRLSQYFLAYLNAALRVYRERSDIFSISGYAPPPELVGIPDRYAADVYLSRRNAATGWATWVDRWCQVDWGVADYDRFRRDAGLRRSFDRGGNDLSRMLDDQMRGRIDSWSIRFSYAHFKHQAYSVCPRWSYVDHAGDDGSGTHVAAGGSQHMDLSRAVRLSRLPSQLQADAAVLAALQRYNSEPWLPWLLGSIPGLRLAVRSLKQWLGIRGRLT